VPINAVTTRDIVDSSKAVGAKKEDLAAAKETGKDLKEVVFVLQPDKTVKLVTVTTGVQDDANIEVLTGLKPGDKVVSAPYSAVSKDLDQGKKVRVVPKKELFENTGK
jgi:HlyD family secretion protein